MRCLVVCDFEVIIEILSPTKRFIRVDLPTFGFPTMFTNPDLCAIILNVPRATHAPLQATKVLIFCQFTNLLYLCGKNFSVWIANTIYWQW